jgi:hypothetical protein
LYSVSEPPDGRQVTRKLRDARSPTKRVSSGIGVKLAEVELGQGIGRLSGITEMPSAAGVVSSTAPAESASPAVIDLISK